MKILFLPCHSIHEYDELRLLSSLGHEVASLGAYIDPAHPHVDTRPALPEVPMVELVKREVDALGQQGHTDTLDAAKRHIPDAILEWADVIIIAGMEHTWLAPQWDRIKHKRVIWRTIGQSADRNEAMMAPLRSEGLEIVRYSPKERNIPGFAGEDALIRFYKDPDEWHGWTGERQIVTNVSQNLYQRSFDNAGHLHPEGHQWTSYGFWRKATMGLPAKPAGPGSHVIGGVGSMDYDRMQSWLRQCRAYLFTGTQPASYTLGLIEAMMTGIPVVSIGPEWYRIIPGYGPEMFEGHEIALLTGDELDAGEHLRALLEDADYAEAVSIGTRQRAIDLFGREKIAAQWSAYLAGAPVPANERELVAA